jgi:transposase-like protein
MSKPFPEPADSFQRIEVITGTGRRRQWPDDVKAAILAETLREGTVITEIARRHRVSASQIFTWRKKARERAAALTAEATSFAPVIMQYPSVQPASSDSLSSLPMIEVEISRGTRPCRARCAAGGRASRDRPPVASWSGE